MVFGLACTTSTESPGPARSENGNALEKGAEIMVTRYDRGIAYVRLWEEMNNEELTAES